MASILCLELLEGPQAGIILQRSGTSLRVGRTRSAALQVKDPAVSESHAELEWKGGRWEIRDLGSTNGTRLNGILLRAQGERPRWLEFYTLDAILS